MVVKLTVWTATPLPRPPLLPMERFDGALTSVRVLVEARAHRSPPSRACLRPGGSLSAGPSF